MRHHLLLCLFACASLAGTSLACAADQAADSASFVRFDERAQAGERLTVVFFGASLTWGANASDQSLTSYRAVLGRLLEDRYPQARFRFYDGAIGGTGSQLGVFRLDREVLARKPDLVFVDFTANDDITSPDPETLGSYEAIIRRLVDEAKVPTVQVLFPFKWNIESGDLPAMVRRTAHLAIAKAYGTGVGDAVALGIERTRAGATTTKALWPFDGVHPGDAGYQLFADAAYDGLVAAIDAGQECRAPGKMLHGDAYLRSTRARIADLTAGKTLPAGWRIGVPDPNGECHDQMMSRWLDSVAIATPISAGEPPVARDAEPLSVRFRGGMVMLFGEATVKSGRYRVLIDGKPATRRHDKQTVDWFDASSARFGGNWNHHQVIATGLDTTVDHTLVIQPIGAAVQPPLDLHLESICVAGGEARVWME